MSETFSVEFAGKLIQLKANYVANQADGAMWVTYGDTVVLVTAVSLKTAREGTDFLPLTVDYQEMTYAAGKIPGSFFRREGRPNERETLTSRLIDRSIRPLFPDGYCYETQVVATVMSVNENSEADVAAMIGASAALGLSDIPFNGPIAGVRVARKEGQFILNPSSEDLAASDLNIFLVGRKLPPAQPGKDFQINLVMLEGEAAEVEEGILVEAINYGLNSLRPIIELQDRVREAVGKAKRAFNAKVIDPAITEQVAALATPGLRDAYLTREKLERYAKLNRVREEVSTALTGEAKHSPSEVNSAFDELERSVLRKMIIADRKRIDGRTFTDIRPINCEVGILPRAHGSAIFTRGETQAMVVVTLGTTSDNQRLDYIGGEELRSFMLHYNFPPYSVGEAKFLRGPGRREIGHGALARKALMAVLPHQDDFPYTIRIVSETLSSNGSSSMAAVCGGALSLMDAGVPVKDVVAGIAMGLLKEGAEVIILSDILGDEDHAGDMDFKVCGTAKGVTAMQMDIKVDEIDEAILRRALNQAREGRLHILGKMKETLDQPRPELSAYAPRIINIRVKPDKVRTVIGSGGKNIRQIISETGVTIDVEDDGKISIASNNAEASARAIAMIKMLTEEAEIGTIYKGTVKKVVDFGAFVEIIPGTEGLVHISQLARERVNKVTDILQEGDEVMVKVLEIDKQGKIRLSRKDALGPDV